MAQSSTSDTSPTAVAISPAGLFSKSLLANTITTPLSFFVLYSDGSVILYDSKGTELVRTSASHIVSKKRGLLTANTTDVTIDGDKSHFIADPSAQHPAFAIGGMPQVASLISSVTDLNTFFAKVGEYAVTIPATTVSASTVPSTGFTQAQAGSVIARKATKTNKIMLYWGIGITLVGLILFIIVSISFGALVLVGIALTIKGIINLKRV